MSIDLELTSPVVVENVRLRTMNADWTNFRYVADKIGSNNRRCHLDVTTVIDNPSAQPGQVQHLTAVVAAEWSTRTDAQSPWTVPYFSTQQKTIVTSTFGAINGNIQDVTVVTDLYDANDQLLFAGSPVATQNDLSQTESFAQSYGAGSFGEMIQSILGE